MSRTTAHRLQNLPRLRSNDFWRGLHDQGWRQVALHADMLRNDLPRRSQISLPVNAEDVRAAGDEVGPVAMGAERELNDGNFAAELGNDVLHPATRAVLKLT